MLLDLTELELSVLLTIPNSLVLACFKPFSEVFFVEITDSSNSILEWLKTAVFSSLEFTDSLDSSISSLLELSILEFTDSSTFSSLLELSILEFTDSSIPDSALAVVLSNLELSIFSFPVSLSAIGLLSASLELIYPSISSLVKKQFTFELDFSLIYIILLLGPILGPILFL